MVELEGRGSAFVREHRGPPGSPTLLLLHGWTVTADLNWGPSYEGLSEHFSLLTLDQRGHGRGIRSPKPFTLEDAADDAVALVHATARDRVIVVGYSMGGPVAQLVWRRNPEVVSGMVLCSTAMRFGGGPVFYGGLMALSQVTRIAPPRLSRTFTANFAKRRFAGLTMADWARDQVAANDTSAMLRAGWAIGGFDSSAWIGDLDVPTAVVITTQDQTVQPSYQRALAAAIPGAEVFAVPGGHGVCLVNPEIYVPVLVQACAAVARRCG